MRPCLAAVVCSLAWFVGACDAPPPPGPPPADDAGTPGPCGGCAPPRVCRTSNVDVEGTCVAPAEEGALCYADDRGDPRVVTLSHACAEGLDCARVVEDFPTLQLACGPEGRLDSLCADLSGLTGDDGCAEEYLSRP